MKRLLCWIFGHVEYTCPGCQAKIAEIFSSGKPIKWDCDELGCGYTCTRCGTELYKDIQ